MPNSLLIPLFLMGISFLIYAFLFSSTLSGGGLRSKQGLCVLRDFPNSLQADADFVFIHLIWPLQLNFT
jgi:hypothetical protein